MNKKMLIFLEKGLLMYEDEVCLTSVPMLKIVGETGIRTGMGLGKVQRLYKGF
jgi:hypothetical protein